MTVDCDGTNVDFSLILPLGPASLYCGMLQPHVQLSSVVAALGVVQWVHVPVAVVVADPHQLH